MTPSSQKPTAIEKLSPDMQHYLIWKEQEDKIKTLREALLKALPHLDNGDSPGGCDGSVKDCRHCEAIRAVRKAIKSTQS